MARKPPDEELDEELEDTFPASDPPSLTEPAGDARKHKAADKPKPATGRAKRPGKGPGKRPGKRS